MHGIGRREEIRVPPQARQVHENVKRCLAAAGATFADVCKVTVFVRNMADRERITSVRPPARDRGDRGPAGVTPTG